MEHPRLGLNPLLGYWKDLMNAAVVETACADLSERIQDVQNAVMDEIETSYPTATDSERRSLINTLNALHELRRIFETPKPGKGPRGILPSDAMGQA